MDHMDQMDQLQQNTNTTNNASQTKALNHPTYRLHAALTRTISTPQPQIKSPTATAAHHLNHLQQQQQQQLQQSQQQQQEPNVAALVNLIETMGNVNLHRKLERTQSEPLPQQVNASR